METQRTDLWTFWGQGWGEMCGEDNTEAYIAICKTDSQWELVI